MKITDAIGCKRATFVLSENNSGNRAPMAEFCPVKNRKGVVRRKWRKFPPRGTTGGEKRQWR